MRGGDETRVAATLSPHSLPTSVPAAPFAKSPPRGACRRLRGGAMRLDSAQGTLPTGQRVHPPHQPRNLRQDQPNPPAPSRALADTRGGDETIAASTLSPPSPRASRSAAPFAKSPPRGACRRLRGGAMRLDSAQGTQPTGQRVHPPHQPRNLRQDQPNPPAPSRTLADTRGGDETIAASTLSPPSPRASRSAAPFAKSPPRGRVGDCAAAQCALIPRKEHNRQGGASLTAPPSPPTSAGHHQPPEG
jgi:hypothetical protein